MVGMFPTGRRFARFTLHPLPDLSGVGRIGVNDEMFLSGLGELAVDFAAYRIARNSLLAGCTTVERNHATFLRDGAQGKRLAVDRYLDGCRMRVPTEFFYEQASKISSGEVLASSSGIERHRRLFTRGSIVPWNR